MKFPNKQNVMDLRLIGKQRIECPYCEQETLIEMKSRGGLFKLRDGSFHFEAQPVFICLGCHKQISLDGKKMESKGKPNEQTNNETDGIR